MSLAGHFRNYPNDRNNPEINCTQCVIIRVLHVWNWNMNGEKNSCELSSKVIKH